MPDPIRVLVCGGRDYSDSDRVFRELDFIRSKRDVDLVVTGGADGADGLGEDWAKERGIPLAVYPALWGFYGKKAGPYRNSWMLRLAQPDIVVAFPGGRGTAHMIAQAKKFGVVVRDIRAIDSRTKDKETGAP